MFISIEGIRINIHKIMGYFSTEGRLAIMLESGDIKYFDLEKLDKALDYMDRMCFYHVK